MAVIMSGKDVAERISGAAASEVAEARKNGTVPTLAIIRIGSSPGDIAYENSAMRRASQIGVAVRNLIFDADITQEELIDEIKKVNEDRSIHGALLLRPLPAHMDDRKVCDSLAPEKDMDGITSGSLAGVFMDRHRGYPPCTAAACMELLEHYGIDLSGKKMTIIGRSLVIGKPVSMMALKQDATVTICHSRTSAEDFRTACSRADIVLSAIGRARMIGADKLGKDQIIIDVGISVDEKGELCGDVDFDEAVKSASMITPVRDGIGSITSSILMRHVADAALEQTA